MLDAEESFAHPARNSRLDWLEAVFVWLGSASAAGLLCAAFLVLCGLFEQTRRALVFDGNLPGLSELSLVAGTAITFSLYNFLIMILPTTPIGVSVLLLHGRISSACLFIAGALFIGSAAFVSSYIYSNFGYDLFDIDGRPQSEDVTLVRYVGGLLVQCLVFAVAALITRHWLPDLSSHDGMPLP